MGLDTTQDRENLKFVWLVSLRLIPPSAATAAMGATTACIPPLAGRRGGSEPHSWCSILYRPVPIVLDEHGKWISSAIPDDCPIVAQGGVPGSAHSSAFNITPQLAQWCVRMLDPNAAGAIVPRDETASGW
jgi:hypothetical protein